MNNYLLERRVAKLEQLVYEAKQVGTLYHVCTLEAYLKYILPTDTLKASGNYTNHLYKSNQFVSFTRDKRFVVKTYSVTMSDIIIQLVIDGDKLSENYKIGPYNDFAFNYVGNDKNVQKDWEMEEVVKGPIKNVSKYIKQVNIGFSIGSNDEHCERLLNLLEAHRKELSNVKYSKFIGKSSIKINDGASIDEIIDTIQSMLNTYKLCSHKLKTVRDAIKSGADVNGININYAPIVCQCGYEGNASIVKLLLKSGADPNGKNEYGTPAIVLAAKYGIPEIVELLVNAGADVNLKSNYGTALQCARKRSGIDGNIIAKILLENGAKE